MARYEFYIVLYCIVLYSCFHFCSQLYIVSSVFCIVMGCACQLVIKENDDDDDESGNTGILGSHKLGDVMKFREAARWSCARSVRWRTVLLNLKLVFYF